MDGVSFGKTTSPTCALLTRCEKVRPRRLVTALAVAMMIGSVLATVGTVTPAAQADTEDCRLPTGEAAPAAPGAEDPATVDRRLEQLHGIYEDLDGFVDVYFRPTAGADYHPTFVGEVPDRALDRDTPVPVQLRAIEERPEPVATSSNQPTPEDVVCEGIRPGGHLAGGCTLSFIFTDGTDLYASTAGHCIEEGDRATLFGVGIFGTVVFSEEERDGTQIGNDFALIKVDDDMEHLVSPEMCDVGGPTSGFGGGSILGEGILHTGRGGTAGLPFVSVPPVPRTGAGWGYGHNSFSWIGGGIPGDSGSGVRLAGGPALGTLTHGGIGFVETNWGTTWERGLEMAASDGITGLELVTAPNHVDGV